MKLLQQIAHALGFHTPRFLERESILAGDDDPDDALFADPDHSHPDGPAVQTLDELVRETIHPADQLPPMDTDYAAPSPTPAATAQPSGTPQRMVTETTAVREAMMAEVDRLQLALRRVQSERDAANQARTSAERQKNALADRLADMDRQLATLEADKEELFGENRRLRVMLKRLDPNADVTLSADEDVDSLLRSIEALKMKNTLADNMVKELQAKAAKATRELQEAHRELDSAAVLAEQMDRFEDYKARHDMRLAELQRTIALRDKEIRSLNSTIEHNLVKHGEAMRLLQDEIRRLRHAETTAPDAPATAEAPAADAAAETQQPHHPRKQRGRGRGRKNHPRTDSPDGSAATDEAADPQLTLF